MRTTLMFLVCWAATLWLTLSPVVAEDAAKKLKIGPAVVDLKELAEHKEEWPETVMLRQQINWPVTIQGFTYNWPVPAGTQVQLVTVLGSTVMVQFNATFNTIPTSATTLVAQVAQARQEKLNAARDEVAGNEFDEQLKQMAVEIKEDQRLADIKGTLAYLDAKNGFRDLKFGRDIAECKTMRLVTEATSTAGKEDVKTYVRERDDLKLERATLKKIQYVFVKGKLMSVEIEARGQASYDLIVDALAGLYGDGLKGRTAAEADASQDSGNGATPERAMSWDGRVAKALVIWLPESQTVHATIASKGIESSPKVTDQTTPKLDAAERSKDFLK